MAERLAKPPALVQDEEPPRQANRIESMGQAVSLCFMPSSGTSVADDPYPPIQPSLRNPEFVRKTCEAARDLLPLFGATGKAKKGAETAVKVVRGARAAVPMSAERTLPQFLQDVDAVWATRKKPLDQLAASTEVISAIRERGLHPELMDAALDIAMVPPGARTSVLHWVRASDGRNFLVVAVKKPVTPSRDTPMFVLRLFDPSGTHLLSKVERTAPFNDTVAQAHLLEYAQSAKEALEPMIAETHATNIANSWTAWRSWMKLAKADRTRSFEEPLPSDPFHRTQ